MHRRTLAGAWIETGQRRSGFDPVRVAPLRVHWLKLSYRYCVYHCPLSHPLRVRGLNTLNGTTYKAYVRRTLAGAWLTFLHPPTGRQIGSHPLRVRGLKPLRFYVVSTPSGRTPCGCVD